MMQSWNYKTDSAKNSEGSIMKFYNKDKYSSVNTYLVLDRDLNFIRTRYPKLWNSFHKFIQTNNGKVQGYRKRWTGFETAIT